MACNKSVCGTAIVSPTRRPRAAALRLLAPVARRENPAVNAAFGAFLTAPEWPFYHARRARASGDTPMACARRVRGPRTAKRPGRGPSLRQEVPGFTYHNPSPEDAGGASPGPPRQVGGPTLE